MQTASQGIKVYTLREFYDMLIWGKKKMIN